MKTVFALIDCNNFFASCERLFRPDLEDRPVVVLSSNDGCVIARSNESKQLGIPMGAPVFKHRETLERYNIAQFSANFELYGDISKRITALLTGITPRIEIYSVDESFLDLSTLAISDYAAWGQAVQKRIRREIGVPVSIGIAASKTLAKLASVIAKQHDEYQGAFSFINLPADERQRLLGGLPVGDVWGVGWRLAPKLRVEGISNALSLASMRSQRARQLMGVHGTQLVAELNDVSCLPLEREDRVAKSIMRSRTFGEDTSQTFVLEAAVASLGAQAAFRLRHAGLLARRIGLFTMTNRHKPGFRSWSRDIRLPTPSNDTGQIISRLITELDAIVSSSYAYHRLGVFLYDFIDEHSLQVDLLGHIDYVAQTAAAKRMQAMDAINRRFGANRLHYAAEDLSRSWRPKRQIRSPRYVSDWNELPRVRIGQLRVAGNE